MARSSFLVRVVVGLSVAALLAPFAGCLRVDVGETVTGSGNLIEKSYDVESFDSVSAKSVLRLKVKPGDQPELIVRADDNVIDHLIIEQEDSTVYLTTESGIRFRNVTITAEVTVPALRKLEVMGAAKIEFDDYATDELNLKVGGAANVTGNLAAKKLDVNTSGAARIVLATPDNAKDAEDESGETSASEPIADSVVIDSSGAVLVDLERFPAKRATVKMSGVGKIRVFAAKQLHVDATGAGLVTYFGNPDDVEINKTGLAKVEQGKKGKG